MMVAERNNQAQLDSSSTNSNKYAYLLDALAKHGLIHAPSI